MKKGWRLIILVVLVAVLLGAVAVAVGFMTGAETSLAVSGLFEAVGQLPETSLSAALTPVDAGGFIPCGENCVTSAAGVFAAGDCRAKEVRQLTTACADGAVAALAACNYCKCI